MFSANVVKFMENHSVSTLLYLEIHCPDDDKRRVVLNEVLQYVVKIYNVKAESFETFWDHEGGTLLCAPTELDAVKADRMMKTLLDPYLKERYIKDDLDGLNFHVVACGASRIKEDTPGKQVDPVVTVDLEPMKQFKLRQPSSLYFFCNEEYEARGGAGNYTCCVQSSDELYKECVDSIERVLKDENISKYTTVRLCRELDHALSMFCNLDWLLNVVEDGKIVPHDCRSYDYDSSIDFDKFAENILNKDIPVRMLYDYIISSINFKLLEELDVIEYIN